MSLAELAERPGVQRLAANTLIAQKRFAEAEEITLRTVEDWARCVRVETLKNFFLSGSLDLEEFEGLLEVVLRNEWAT